MLFLIALPQSHMYAPDTLIRLKLILAVPLRGDQDFIAARRKPVRQIGDHPLRAALFQAV